MIHFQSITLRNFWSFGNAPTTVPLNEELTALIIGENRDKGDAGESKNGAGKTALLQAVVWTLFGEGLDRIKQDNFINFTNKKNMECRLIFSTATHVYEVVRGRKPNKVEVYQDGKECTKDSANNTDALIQDIIGMTFDIFINTCLLYPHTSPFMAMKGSEQRDFMEELLALNMLTQRADSLKSRAKDNRTDIKMEEQRVESAQANNAKVQERINALTEKARTWDADQEQLTISRRTALNTIESFIENEMDANFQALEHHEARKEQLKEMETVVGEHETKVSEYNLRKAQIDARLDALDQLESKESIRSDNEAARQKLTQRLDDEFGDFDAEGLINKIHEIDTEREQLATLERTERDASDEHQRIGKELDGKRSELEHIQSGKCPYCKQKYVNSEVEKALKDDIDALLRETEDLERTIDELAPRIESARHKIESGTREAQQFMGRASIDLNEKAAMAKSHELDQLKASIHGLDAGEADRIERMEQTETRILNELAGILSIQDIDAISDKLEAQDAELARAKQDLDAAIAEKKVVQADIEKVEARIRDNELLSLRELQRVERDRDALVAEIESMKQEENPYTEQLKGMAGLLQSEDRDELYRLQKIDDHYGILVKLLTDNNSFIRKNIINQYVPYINKRANMYLSRLDSQHLMQINPDLSVDLFYMLDEPVSYGNLSRGERLRLNLATSLAFRDLNGMLGKSTNLLMIDEYLDSALDQAGFNQVFNLIKGYADHTMIISHRDDLLPRVDKIIKVVKHNGFSELEAG